MKTVLITGGSGFIGTNLCRSLLADGHRVIALDNNYTGRLTNIQDLLEHPNFSFVQADVKSPLPVEDKLDEIYNLACPASPFDYQGAHAIDTTLTCVLGATNVLELALKNDCTVLQASTSEVYGDPDVTPQSESYRGNVNPNGIRSCYDEGKRCAESLFFDYHRHKGAKIKVIRIFNTYGPYMQINDGRVVSNFICQALQGQPITIYGQGQQTRSFCYVDDLVKLMKLIMATGEEHIGPFNTGNPYEITVKDLAERVIRLTGSNSSLVYQDLPSDDPKQRCPDITKVRNLLNWEPEIDLEHGLIKSIAYFKQQLKL